MTASQASNVDISNTTVKFGDFTAVDNVNLSIESGEFFTLLGPSGCGKTTLLRAIAGFVRQSEGNIEVGGDLLDDLPAHRRDTGMVFQNYAVFPHLNVHDNVAYGLKSRGISGAEAEKRIADALQMVDLEGYENRMPRQLSGGQQQRVVIARAVVIRPRILLMDEPLANLDAKLRDRLRNDLKMLQNDLGITTIYVTHDQLEALSLSDRIAVMSKGRVLQVGEPHEIYTMPATRGVAEFVGEGNFLRGTVSEKSGPEGTLISVGQSDHYLVHTDADLGDEVTLGFRPEDVIIGHGNFNEFHGSVINSSYLGSSVRLELRTEAGETIVAEVAARSMEARAGIGETITFAVPSDRIMVFPDEEVSVL